MEVTYHPLAQRDVVEALRYYHHVLYDVRTDSIRVMVVRHDKRHPNYGMNRE